MACHLLHVFAAGAYRSCFQRRRAAANSVDLPGLSAGFIWFMHNFRFKTGGKAEWYDRDGNCRRLQRALATDSVLTRKS